MVTGHVKEAKQDSVTIQATRIAELPSLQKESWPSEVESLQKRLSR